MATNPSPAGQGRRDWSLVIDRGVLSLARHWLALINLFWGLYVGLPAAAPLFMEMGWTPPAKAIYLLFRPACHQRPDRSYFLTGPKVAYSTDELKQAGVVVAPFSRDIGNERVGWKVAICERDVAIYGSLFVGGMVYALARKRLGGWQMRLRYYAIFVLPMGIDGVLQLFGVYESTWVLRTITGAWFGLGTIVVAYPVLQKAFLDVQQSQERRLGRPSSL